MSQRILRFQWISSFLQFFRDHNKSWSTLINILLNLLREFCSNWRGSFSLGKFVWQKEIKVLIQQKWKFQEVVLEPLIWFYSSKLLKVSQKVNQSRLKTSPYVDLLVIHMLFLRSLNQKICQTTQRWHIAASTTTKKAFFSKSSEINQEK